MNKPSVSAFARLLFICFIFTFRHTAQGAQLYYDQTATFQTMEGFGGGFFQKLPLKHPKKDALYDSIFNSAGVNILRIPNWYDPSVNNAVDEIPLLLEIQKKWPQVKTILASWTPPPYLKNNGSLIGTSGTLRKKSDSTYMYDEYADYWLKSIRYFRQNGVKIDWVSIQNEPDFEAPFEGCLFNPLENTTIASYGKALNAVYNKCNVENNENILFIGPDVAGIANDRLKNYVVSPEFNTNQIFAYCHHYYDYSGPDWLRYAGSLFKDKPIFQTEFLVNENDFRDTIRTWHYHAQIIHNHLALENVKMYCLFTLAYKPLSTHCMFSMDTSGGDWYQVRPTYFMFKHFSKSIHRGWVRIAAASDDTSILVSMFQSPAKDSSAVVLINTAPVAKTIEYLFPGMSGEMYQTTDSIKYAASPLTSSGNATLPVKSITTFDLRTVSRVKVPQEKTLPSGMIGEVRGMPNAVVVRYSARHTPSTLSLVDLHGSVIASMQLPMAASTNGGIVSFRRPAAPGTYIVKMTSGSSVAIKTCTLLE